MLGGSISLDRDAVRAEQARQQACERQGRKFIPLRLIDRSKNRIQGAYTLIARPYLDTVTNQVAYSFTETGGCLDFAWDDYRGGYYVKMLDCEYNRRFLASHLASNHWEICDKDVLTNVELIAAETAAKAIRKTKEQVNVPVETMLSDADLETEMARLQAEAAKRKIKKAEDNRTPVRAQVPVQEEQVAENSPSDRAVEDLVTEAPSTTEDSGVDPVPTDSLVDADEFKPKVGRPSGPSGKRRAKSGPSRSSIVTE
jgi:hypothetical protein